MEIKHIIVSSNEAMKSISHFIVSTPVVSKSLSCRLGSLCGVYLPQTYHALAQEFARIEHDFHNSMANGEAYYMTKDFTYLNTTSKPIAGARMAFPADTASISLTIGNTNIGYYFGRTLDQKKTKSQQKNTNLLDSVFEFVENYTPVEYSNRFIVDSTMTSDANFNYYIANLTTENWKRILSDPKGAKSITNNGDKVRLSRIVLSRESLDDKLDMVFTISSTLDTSSEWTDEMFNNIPPSLSNEEQSSSGQGHPKVHLFIDEKFIPQAIAIAKNEIEKHKIAETTMSSRKDDTLLLLFIDLYKRWRDERRIDPNAKGIPLINFAITYCGIIPTAEIKTIASVINKKLR